MTTVRLPLRIRVEVADDQLDERLVDHVRDAADAALSRAVTRASAVGLVASAEPNACTLRASVHFTGDPLPRPVAEALETSLRTCAYVAGERLRLSARGRHTGGVRGDDPPTEHTERRDDDRVVRDAAGNVVYQVPYYHRRGKKMAVRMHGVPSAQGPTPSPPLPQRLRRFSRPSDLGEAIMDRTGGRPPGHFVAVYAVEGGKGGAWAMFLDTVRDAQGRVDFRSLAETPLGVYDFPGGTQKAVLRPVGFLQADRWSVYGSASNAAQVRQMLIQAASLVLQRSAPKVSDEELRRQAGYIVDELPYATEPSLTLFKLTSHNEVVWIGPTDRPVPRDDRRVLVFTEDDPESREDTYGKDCPNLDDLDPRIWLSMLGLTHPSPSTPGGPFLGEPAIANWPPAISARLDQKVRSIAAMVHLEPGPFVGGFLIAALAHIDSSCRILTSNRAPMWPQIEAKAAAFLPIRELFQEYVTIMLSQDDLRALPCPVAGQSRAWCLRFAEVFGSARDDAVASLFVSTCQDILLQVLFSSGDELSRRAQHFSQYMAMTRMLLTVMLTDTVELMDLRDAVIERERRAAMAAMGSSMALGASTVTAWAAVAQDLVDGLPDEPVSREPKAGTVVLIRGGYRVYDGKGRWWSRREIDALVTQQRQQVSSVDPLFDKVVEVDDLVRSLKKAQELDANASTEAGRALTSHVDDVFRHLLSDLLEENQRWQRKAAIDRKLAFGLANFKEPEARSASDISASVSGIHRLAHERLEKAFTDREAYTAGILRLRDEELGKAELEELLSLVGLTALAIVCPVLALGVGVVQAGEGLYTAFEHRDLQRAMLDADEILSKAQVEAEIWAAVISAALTVLPEVPSLARGATKLTGAAIRGEATEAVATATRQAMRDIVKHLAELSFEHFALRFTKELVQGYLINLALSKAIGRIADSVAQQVGVKGHASAGDVFEVLSGAISGGPS